MDSAFSIHLQFAGESVLISGEHELCLDTKIALLDAAKQLAEGDSESAEKELKKVAKQIITADCATIKQCLETIQNYSNPIICHRLCLAILAASCKLTVPERTDFFDQFCEILPNLRIDVTGKELIDTWGVDSVENCIGEISRDEVFRNFLFTSACWPLYRKVGLAILEECQRLSASLYPKLNDFAFPCQRHRTRVTNALKYFSPKSLSKIDSVEAFDVTIKDILRELTPPFDQNESTLSREDSESIHVVNRHAKSAAKLLSQDLLSKNLDEQLDSCSPLTLRGIIDFLASISFLVKLTKGKKSVLTTFAASYLMDGLDVFVKEHHNGLGCFCGGILFTSLAKATYNVMNIDRTHFIRKLGDGWKSSAATEALLPFLKSGFFDQIADHFHSQMQILCVDEIVNSSEKVNHIALGWVDKKDGHFMWAVVRRLLSEWQVKIINTGCGIDLHDQIPAPSGSGLIYALSKTHQGIGVDKLRDYLMSATRFNRIGKLSQYFVQNGWDPNDEDARDDVALSVIYDGVKGDSAIDVFYGKGQRSITCVTKCFNAVIRCEDPESYTDFHLISKMLAFTTWYGRFAAEGKCADLEIEFSQTIAKELFFRLSESGAPPELLEAIAHFLATDDMWKFKCVPIVKSVYASHLQWSNNAQTAAAWLKYIYKLSFPAGLQCTAEVIDEHVNGRRSFEVAVDALKLLAKYASDKPKAYTKLEKRCQQLSQFPWEKLKNDHYKLVKRIVKQMSLSKKEVSLYRTLRSLLCRQTNPPLKRVVSQDWPSGNIKNHCSDTDLNADCA
ncbi:MAG: hypothetical protein Q8K75_04615 [Chlamydiales bacterium]|nr:hypothetical protein [Chlamydiales bacterium]